MAGMSDHLLLKHLCNEADNKEVDSPWAVVVAQQLSTRLTSEKVWVRIPLDTFFPFSRFTNVSFNRSLVKVQYYLFSIKMLAQLSVLVILDISEYEIYNLIPCSLLVLLVRKPKHWLGRTS